MNNEIEWDFKQHEYKRPLYDSYDFWYDLTDGGYIKPEEIINEDQVKQLKDAISIIESFKKAYELFCEEE